MSPRALLALLALSAASSAVAVARPEATPVGSTPGPTPLGDAVRRDEAVVFASSMTAVHEEDLGWYGGEDASRSWYVRCHALASPGETRLAGTLPVVRPAAKRAVVPLGFALGTVSPANDTVLACALFDLLPGVSRARVSRAVLPLARFADAADAAAVLSFPRGGSGSHAWVSLELRCDACVKERVFVSASSKKKKKKKTRRVARRVLRRGGDPRRRDVRARRPRRRAVFLSRGRTRRGRVPSSPREAQDERRAFFFT